MPRTAGAFATRHAFDGRPAAMPLESERQPIILGWRSGGSTPLLRSCSRQPLLKPGAAFRRRRNRWLDGRDGPRVPGSRRSGRAIVGSVGASERARTRRVPPFGPRSESRFPQGVAHVLRALRHVGGAPELCQRSKPRSRRGSRRCGIPVPTRNPVMTWVSVGGPRRSEGRATSAARPNPSNGCDHSRGLRCRRPEARSSGPVGRGRRASRAR